MSAELAAFALLNERFLIDHPREAARVLESLPADANISLLQSHSHAALVRGWQALSSDRGAAVLDALPPETAGRLLTEADPQVSIAALAHLPAARCDALLATLPAQVIEELRELMAYPPGTVGNLMDPRIGALGAVLTVTEAIERLRSLRQNGLRELFVVDDQLHLVGQLSMEDLVLSGRERPVREIMRSVAAVVRDTDQVARIAKVLKEQPLDVLPVTNAQGRFKGVIRLPALMATVRRQRRWWQLA
jgi:magnesium transporter